MKKLFALLLCLCLLLSMAACGNRKEAEEIISDFYELIKGNLPEDEDKLEEAIVYINIHNFPPRAKCATLSWRALDALLHGELGEKSDE